MKPILWCVVLTIATATVAILSNKKQIADAQKAKSAAKAESPDAWIRVPRKWGRIIVAVPTKTPNSFIYFDLPNGSEVYVADDKEQVLVLELK